MAGPTGDRPDLAMSGVKGRDVARRWSDAQFSFERWSPGRRPTPDFGRRSPRVGTADRVLLEIKDSTLGGIFSRR